MTEGWRVPLPPSAGSRHAGAMTLLRPLLPPFLPLPAPSPPAAPATAPAAQPRAAPDSLDAVARDYVRLVLELGERDDGYVDAYYGPPALRAAARANPRTLPQLP